MKIYTKTGDNGETGIVGSRLLKNNPIIECIGVFDELNASLGIVITEIKLDETLNEFENVTNTLNILFQIQDAIFEVGSILANTRGGTDYLKLTSVLEKEIDSLEEKLPKLQNFILPGGCRISSLIHLSRTICRRAERSLVNLKESKKLSNNVLKDKEFSDILIFVNRLSDYLFEIARYFNVLKNCEEIIWNKDKKF